MNAVPAEKEAGGGAALGSPFWWWLRCDGYAMMWT